MKNFLFQVTLIFFSLILKKGKLGTIQNFGKEENNAVKLYEYNFLTNRHMYGSCRIKTFTGVYTHTHEITWSFFCTQKKKKKKKKEKEKKSDPLKIFYFLRFRYDIRILNLLFPLKE